jgi:hypothetical protein
MKRRTFLHGALAAAVLPLTAWAEKKPVITVYKTPTCGCCHEWVAHLEHNGFRVDARDVPSTTPYRAKFGVPADLGSCHTGVIDGYALEGHVPASDISRLLAERPKARGLAVPGMPVGSPGMEVEGTRRDAFDVVLFADDGSRKVFQRYAARR